MEDHDVQVLHQNRDRPFLLKKSTELSINLHLIKLMQFNIKTTHDLDPLFSAIANREKLSAFCIIPLILIQHVHISMDVHVVNTCSGLVLFDICVFVLKLVILITSLPVRERFRKRNTDRSIGENI